MGEKHTKVLMSSIGVWVGKIQHYPGWREWNRNKMSFTLYDAADEENREAENEFKFSEQIEIEHAVVMSFLSLSASAQALADTEYYFRRYPFQNLPISKDTHIRYICEMYFSRFYELKERFKRCLNAVKSAMPNSDIQIGLFLKQFNKEFDRELKQRNEIHHKDRFEDRIIDRLSMTNLMGEHPKLGRGWKSEHDATYRKASNEWANRVKRRSIDANQFVETVAEFIVTNCRFLSDVDPVLKNPASISGS